MIGPQIPAPEDISARKTVRVIPALISAVLSVGLIRSGFPAFLFLVPLGFMAYGYNFLSAWATVLAAALMNSIFSLGAALFFSDAGAYLWIDMFYFALMTAVFTWIVAPPQMRVLRFSLAYRFIAGSVIGVLVSWLTARESFDAFFRSLGETGTNVVQSSFLGQQHITSGNISPEIIIAFMLRGGGIASCVVIFFVSRQISLLFTRLIRRIHIRETISYFHVAPELIWVLSFALLGVLAGSIASITPLEILAWNIITICGILYLGQGSGIVWHFLSQRNLPPLILNILIIMLLFSPGINAVILGLLILLGIAEHWAPFRAPKSDGPSSTPRM